MPSTPIVADLAAGERQTDVVRHTYTAFLADGTPFQVPRGTPIIATPALRSGDWHWDGTAVRYGIARPAAPATPPASGLTFDALDAERAAHAYLDACPAGVPRVPEGDPTLRGRIHWLAEQWGCAEAARQAAEQERDRHAAALAIADEWFGGCDCITTESGGDARKQTYWALRKQVRATPAAGDGA